MLKKKDMLKLVELKPPEWVIKDDASSLEAWLDGYNRGLNAKKEV